MRSIERKLCKLLDYEIIFFLFSETLYITNIIFFKQFVYLPAKKQPPKKQPTVTPLFIFLFQ